MAISLFSSAGIGELGILNTGVEVICANELVGSRCQLYKENYRETKLFEGDVWHLNEKIIEFTKTQLDDDELFLVYATPPCQGMSTNGYGKLKAEVEAGRRAPIDARNELVIPALTIIKEVNPKWVLFENVPGMRHTVIEHNGELIKIVDLIKRELGSKYIGNAEVVECSKFGIPQLRKRLITVYTRDEAGIDYFKKNGSFFSMGDQKPLKTLWDAISDFPILDAKKGLNKDKNDPLHYVNIMNEEKYWWVENTKEGDTAFNTQCVNEECRFQLNRKHVDTIENGKAVSSRETPIYCEKCGSLLPRPSLIDKKTGERRAIRGFHSAYRRMVKDTPARTLTRNFPFEASDNKIHPTQNRVLSISEALRIQTISDYEYKWCVDGKTVNKSVIADCIGESVPPALIEIIVQKMIELSSGRFEEKGQQKLDFSCSKN